MSSSSLNSPNAIFSAAKNEIGNSSSSITSIQWDSPLVIRDITRVGDKTQGNSSGFVGQTPGGRRYMVKDGFSIDAFSSFLNIMSNSKKAKVEESDAIYEFTFASVFTHFLGDKAPKVKLWIKDGFASTASRLIEGFIPLSGNLVKPDNLEELIAIATFLGDDDWHQNNVGVGGLKIDHGRASSLKSPNALLFISTLEFLFQARYGCANFDLDYHKLLTAFQRIEQEGREVVAHLVKERIAILRDNAQSKSLSEVSFLNIPVNQDLSNVEQFKDCIGSVRLNSWNEYEFSIDYFLSRQYAMLPQIINILDAKVKLQQSKSSFVDQDTIMIRQASPSSSSISDLNLPQAPIVVADKAAAEPLNGLSDDNGNGAPVNVQADVSANSRNFMPTIKFASFLTSQFQSVFPSFMQDSQPLQPAVGVLAAKPQANNPSRFVKASSSVSKRLNFGAIPLANNHINQSGTGSLDVSLSPLRLDRIDNDITFQSQVNTNSIAMSLRA